MPVMDDLLQVAEVNTMKLGTVSFAIALVVTAGTAAAAGQNQVLEPIVVHGGVAALCTPPNGATGHVCDGYDQLVRANFTSREIGMLFGYQTSYPENLTGGIDRVRQRYDALVQRYLTAQATVKSGATVAAK